MWFEEQEETDAEDDRERAEAERISIATRPAEQAVEAVREEQLGENEGEKTEDEVIVGSPVQDQRALSARLDPMLWAPNDFDRERAARAPCKDEERDAPDEQYGGGADERALEDRVSREERERRDDHGDDGWK